MIEIITYKCSSCDKVFSSKEECKEHELECYPCNHCKHQYFVYGCDERCKYSYIGECDGYAWKRNNFKKYFEEK